MKRLRNRLRFVVIMLSFVGNATAQDIEIKSFKQNVTSLIGSVSPIFDNTGQACAVIRFSVRDTTFVIGGNQGVLKKITQLGEILIYVPATTKRLTIRHEGLLPLRYEIPMKLEAKKTYDALLIAVNTPLQPEQPMQQEQPTQQETPLETPLPPEQPKETTPERIIKQKEIVNAQLVAKVRKESEKPTRMTLGIGYQIMALSGPSVSIGIDANHHLVELDAVYGLNKSDELTFYRSNTTSNDLIATRQYSPFRVQLKYGYELKLAKAIGIAPMIGGAMNIFSSESGKESSSTYQDHYLKASSFSITPGVRIAAVIGRHMKLHITSEYAFGVYKSNNCKLISDYDSKFKSWTDGFNINAGVIFLF